MANYVKAKKYIIRPSKKEEVIDYIKNNFTNTKYQTALSRVIENKSMSWKRWMYYFDYNYLEDILMGEDCIEINEDDLGI